MKKMIVKTALAVSLFGVGVVGISTTLPALVQAITIDELESVDLSKVDLSKLEALIAEADYAYNHEELYTPESYADFLISYRGIDRNTPGITGVGIDILGIKRMLNDSISIQTIQYNVASFEEHVQYILNSLVFAIPVTTAPAGAVAQTNVAKETSFAPLLLLASSVLTILGLLLIKFAKKIKYDL